MDAIGHHLVGLAGIGGGTAIAAHVDALIVAVDPAGGAVAAGTPGQRNQRLLAVHTRLCAPDLEACAPCPACQERNAFDLPIGAVLALPAPNAAPVTVRGARFRLPTVGDVRALDGALPVAPQIARACRIEGPELHGEAAFAELEAAFEAADPAANLSMMLACSRCATEFEVALDVALLVGTALSRLGDGLLRDIDTIATAYGWGEDAILALPPARRRAYVAMIATRRRPAPARLGELGGAL